MPQWRETYKPARFFIMDARVMFLVLACLVHLRWYTIVPTIAVCAILFFVEKRLEMNVASAVRAIRSWAAGKVRPARNVTKLRGRVDFDRLG